MKSEDFIGRIIERGTQHLTRIMEQHRAELCAQIDRSHRQLVRWMVACFTLQAIACIAIDRLL